MLTPIGLEEKPMKPLVSGSVLGAIAAAAMLLPLAAVPAAAQMPAGSYLQSCHDVQIRGDRLTATCRTQEGSWNQTSLSNIGQCAGGISNYNGRLACGTHGGGFSMGTDSGRDRRDEGRQTDRDRRDEGRQTDRDRRDDDRRANRDRRDDNRQTDRDRRDDDRRSDRDRRDYGSRSDRDWRDQGWRRDRDWNGYGSAYGPYGPGREQGGRW
jgi:hypothetical protein